MLYPQQARTRVGRPGESVIGLVELVGLHRRFEAVPEGAPGWPLVSPRASPLVCAVVGALVFAEDALFFGFVLPGETVVVLGGVLASQGQVSVYSLALTVVLAAIAGDTVGYSVGHHFGPKILTTDRYASARNASRRHRTSSAAGPEAVFWGRSSPSSAR
ncbi:DedA family protein [Streptomyces sp. NPDC056728]